MHQLKKKILAGIFSVALILTLVAGSVFAADETIPEPTEIVSQETEEEAVLEATTETEEAVLEATTETEEAVLEATAEAEEAVSGSEETDVNYPDEMEEEIPLSDGEPVIYLDKNGKEAKCTSYRVIDGSIDVKELTNGVYVVSGNVTIGHSLTIKGNVSLILKDKCCLKMYDSISIPSGSNSLTIYAQSTEDETIGRLDIEAGDKVGKAGIEVNKKSSGLTICGGKIHAYSGKSAAAIGGSYQNSDSGSIIIYGGDIVANAFLYGGAAGGAGIGGGREGDCYTVTIYGGKVFAVGGRRAAGIGGGAQGDSEGTITIAGGHVEARGGEVAAGIGGGCYGNANTVVIAGGETIATGGEGGAGIGGGEESPLGNGGEFKHFEFRGGTVKATATPDDSYNPARCAKAIGEGVGGDNTVKYTFSFGDGYLLVNNKTGKPCENTFRKNFASLVRTESCDLSIVPTSAYPVSYLTQDAYGETVEAECKEDYKLFYYNYNYTLELTSGWYVMRGEAEYENGIIIKGDVHLILTDGCTLTVRNGIQIGKNSELFVYGQSEGENAGKLIAHGTYYRAGIGGNGHASKGGSSGKLTIRGGNVTADGSYSDGSGACAGIGGICGWPDIKPVELSMYGGELTAVGLYGSAGIGGCRKAPGGIVNIYGGTINASSYSRGYDIVGRAIGGYNGNPDNGKVYVGSNVVLVDNNTGETITKGPGEEWIDKFAAPSISITAKMGMPPVSYLYYDEETETYKEGSCEKYITNDNATDSWTGGWYVLDGDCTFDKQIWVFSDTHIILKDGCKATFKDGIRIESAKLYIHSQSYGDNMGEMEVFRTDKSGAGKGKAGIRTFGSYLYVHGGKILAEGGYGAPGIGGNVYMDILINESGGNITVYEGQLEGIGGSFAAGIGSGGYDRGGGGTLTVIGGTVIAEGSSFAAGIGGGERTAGGTVNLYGGTVIALSLDEGRAIGGGAKISDNGTINVKEGYVIIDNITGEEIKNEDGRPWTEILTGEAVNIRVERKPGEVKEIYRIISGADSKWTKGSTADLTITSDASFDKFRCVMVDGSVLGEENYTAKEGSTDITLKASYLNTLSAGTHTMSIVSNDGKATTYLVISEKGVNPNTGDDTNLMWVMSILAGSILLMIAGLRLRKQKK